ncbi:MAG: twin-arginine translocase subunit TatC [Pseudarcicella sp.]|nr:twin-arginine translocase subunit TatC [Pseudarcicella sp.]MBP6410484.1 twin-arginine translocase subunit TatC [Pseudarcicella sp.]
MALDQDFESSTELATEKEMTFIDHIEELRWHLIRSVIAVFSFTMLAWVYKKEIFGDVIMGPSKADFWTNKMLCKVAALLHIDGLCFQQANFILQSREVSGQFIMAITQSLTVGVLFSFPYFFWEIWRFVTPGLKQSESAAARGAVFFVSLLFFMGVAFGYFVVAPMAINFLASFKLDESIQNQFDINDYISLLVTLTLSCGLTFQLPMVSYVLSKIGILTPSLMREYRRYALVVILIVAAIITPSPDMISQLLVATPLAILYEVGILVSAKVYLNRMKAML